MLSAVTSQWNITLARIREEIAIAGSPERTDYRAVIEDTHERLFIVERLAPVRVPHKERTAQVLRQLHDKGFGYVAPYCVHPSGKYVHQVDEGYWQIVSYVPGQPLDRPFYVFDSWRGQQAAEVITALRRASAGRCDFHFSGEPFDLPAYIDSLVGVIRRRRPSVMVGVEPLYQHVRENLYPVYAALPTAFCHGDFHAMNVIWGDATIEALIDWEFMGLKPELYDAANMIACFGIEDPAALWTGAPVSFVRALRASGLFAPESFGALLEMVLAIRFAWISEWLRKNDDEMLQMEQDYFEVITANRNRILAGWGIS